MFGAPFDVKEFNDDAYVDFVCDPTKYDEYLLSFCGVYDESLATGPQLMMLYAYNEEGDEFKEDAYYANLAYSAASNQNAAVPANVSYPLLDVGNFLHMDNPENEALGTFGHVRVWSPGTVNGIDKHTHFQAYTNRTAGALGHVMIAGLAGYYAGAAGQKITGIRIRASEVNNIRPNITGKISIWGIPREVGNGEFEQDTTDFTETTPTAVSSSGAFDSGVTTVMAHKIDAANTKLVHIGLEVTVPYGAKGTAGGHIDVPLPYMPKYTGLFSLHGKERNQTGKALTGLISTGGSTGHVQITNYDNTFPHDGSNAPHYLSVSGSYARA